MKTNLCEKKNMGIYIHIPFCIQKCAYCAFPSIPLPRDEPFIKSYFDALFAEISTYQEIASDYQCQTIYFGGGTPSCVSETYIVETIRRLGDVFGFDPQNPTIETTIEVNPGAVTPEKLEAYRQAGFNRLSIGLQAAQNHLLQALGRIHDRSDFEALISVAGSMFDNISADLMFGLPGQTLTDLIESIDFLLAFPSIRHISAYSLSIEPNTPFETAYANGKIMLPSEDFEREMAHMLIKHLADHGFEQYEISNFAKLGYESRHNSTYWDLTPYLGFGSGAASFFEKRRRTHTADVQDYIDGVFNGKIPNTDDHILSFEELKGDYLFLGLRRLSGIDATDYEKRFGENLFDAWGEIINDLCKKGLLIADTIGIRLTPLGCDLANQVFMAFV